jgi:hypothetical protein
MIIQIFVIILVLFSFYFSFLPHNTQCDIIRMFFPNCFPQWLHLIGGIGCFAFAVILYHNEYLLKIRIHDK